MYSPQCKDKEDVIFLFQIFIPVTQQQTFTLPEVSIWAICLDSSFAVKLREIVCLVLLWAYDFHIHPSPLSSKRGEKWRHEEPQAENKNDSVFPVPLWFTHYNNKKRWFAYWNTAKKWSGEGYFHDTSSSLARYALQRKQLSHPRPLGSWKDFHGIFLRSASRNMV